MRLNKAFTLAEILIVLMVIGVIAALTVPSVMKGVTEAQLKTGYRKALNYIQNIAAAEKIAGFLPTTNISSETMRFFGTLNTNLSVNSYVSKEASTANSRKTINNSDYVGAINIGGIKFGSGEKLAGDVGENSITTYDASPWIVTDDNIAYSVMCGGETGVPKTCGTVAEIVAQKNQADAILKSCSIVIVDVNGLSKGPNAFDPQAGPQTGVRLNTFATAPAEGSPLKTLTGDQFLIFLGTDGATAGPKVFTVTGRIAADLK